MNELIGQLASNAGIDNAVAEKTIGIMQGFRRSGGPSDEVQALIDRIPGAEAAIAAASHGMVAAWHTADGAWPGRRSEHRGRTFQTFLRQNRSKSMGEIIAGTAGVSQFA